MQKQKVLILGASGGIGSALVKRLHQSKAQLFLAGRNVEKLQAQATQYDSAHSILDATSITEVENVMKHATAELGTLTGIVNCVGSVLLKPAHRTTEEEWCNTIAQNLTSAFATVRSGADQMRQSGGSIVLISSAAAAIGLPNHEAIAAAKAGIEGLVRSAAATYAKYRLRVNAVAPGLVKTPMTQTLWSNEKSEEVSKKLHPLGRLGEPDDIASVIEWLLSSKNDWITGEIIRVDGGLSSLKSH